VRDQEFVAGLAAFAKRNDAVVELNGGILSHAYYLLSAAGCDVECADLDEFANDDETAQFNKLVRDKVPEAIASRGEAVALLRVRGQALVESLRRKLIEEAFEVLDAKTNEEIAEELADVQEVTRALVAELGISASEVEAARRRKLRRRGGFHEGVMLQTTAISPPIARKSLQGGLPLDDFNPTTARTIFDPADLPSSISEEVNIDLRHDSSGCAERQVTAALPAHAVAFQSPRAVFNLPTALGGSHEMIVEFEVERRGADLRIRLRLRNPPLQLDLPL
jgi:predicted house-cleaning noncanonical NTP pyrophosphatase (MazG superfamily)